MLREPSWNGEGHSAGLIKSVPRKVGPTGACPPRSLVLARLGPLFSVLGLQQGPDTEWRKLGSTQERRLRCPQTPADGGCVPVPPRAWAAGAVFPYLILKAGRPPRVVPCSPICRVFPGVRRSWEGPYLEDHRLCLLHF